jgi:hypothetical protein
VVGGQAETRFGTLIAFPEQEIPDRATLVVRGVVEDGGIQIGIIARGEWTGFVTVTAPGPFEAVLQIQRAGRYRPTIASCIEGSAWSTLLRHWSNGSMRELLHGFMPQRVRIERLGLSAMRRPH